MWKAANGTGEEELLFRDSTGAHCGPTGWSHDGKTILLALIKDQWDIYTFDINTRRPKVFLASPFTEISATMSPDGKYIAYESEETGQPEVYVREVGGTGGKWQISTNVGRVPTWRADGKELFFLGRPWSVYAVDVETGASFKASIPKKLFDVSIETSSFRQRRYDVTADGQKFIINRKIGTGVVSNIVTILNWSAERTDR
jgi:Tol biopolymer transport system component